MLELADRGAAMASQLEHDETTNGDLVVSPDYIDPERRARRVLAIRDRDDAVRLADEGPKHPNSVVVFELDVWRELGGDTNRSQVLLWSPGDSDDGESR